MKIIIGNHELEFDDELVKTFEKVTFGDFQGDAVAHLKTNLEECNIEKIFCDYSEQEIRDVIIDSANKEIALYRGKI